MIFYGFAVAFTQGVADYYTQSGDPRDRVLDKFWGNLPRAMYTLFLSITSGVSWLEAATPLHKVDAFWVGLFISFIVFVVLAVLNVITGVFCQSAIDSAQMDKEMVTMHMMANKKWYVDALNRLFNEIDQDGSGKITLAEFEKYLENDECRLYLDSLDINAQDAWALFKILDADQEGTIDIDEFVNGCLSLKGPAKAMHFAKMEAKLKVVERTLKIVIEDLSEKMLSVASRDYDVGKTRCC